MIANLYGTDGGAACAFKSADERRQAEAIVTEMIGPSRVDPRFRQMVLAIYCPRLL